VIDKLQNFVLWLQDNI